jgi:hypothetical protein
MICDNMHHSCVGITSPESLISDAFIPQAKDLIGTIETFIDGRNTCWPR